MRGVQIKKRRHFKKDEVLPFQPPSSGRRGTAPAVEVGRAFGSEKRAKPSAQAFFPEEGGR